MSDKSTPVPLRRSTRLARGNKQTRAISSNVVRRANSGSSDDISWFASEDELDSNDSDSCEEMEPPDINGIRSLFEKNKEGTWRSSRPSFSALAKLSRPSKTGASPSPGLAFHSSASRSAQPPLPKERVLSLRTVPSAGESSSLSLAVSSHPPDGDLVPPGGEDFPSVSGLVGRIMSDLNKVASRASAQQRPGNLVIHRPVASALLPGDVVSLNFEGVITKTTDSTATVRLVTQNAVSFLDVSLPFALLGRGFGTCCSASQVTTTSYVSREHLVTKILGDPRAPVMTVKWKPKSPSRGSTNSQTRSLIGRPLLSESRACGYTRMREIVWAAGSGGVWTDESSGSVSGGNQQPTTTNKRRRLRRYGSVRSSEQCEDEPSAHSRIRTVDHRTIESIVCGQTRYIVGKSPRA